MSRRAGIYVRISSDPSGERLGVQRQRSACEDRAKQRGWFVAKIYEDNDVSASTGKPRPAYEEMLRDLESGQIDAVVVWDLDRLTRRPIEIERIIDLAERQGVQLASVGGDCDLATDNGRMFARIKGAVARQEIERKSARQRAANEQRASLGKPHAGRRAYGYTQSAQVIPDEADELRNAAQAVIAGLPLRRIVREMNSRGARTTAGNPWKPTELRRALSNPRYAGLLRHRGVIVGEGTWQPIFDRDTYDTVVAVLDDPRRHKAGPPERHLLSGLALCATCGARIYGARQARGPLYTCETRAHVVRRSEAVDEFVRDVLVARLASPDVADALSADSDELEVLLTEERMLRARLDQLATAFALGEISREQLRAGSEVLQTKLRACVNRIVQTTRTQSARADAELVTTETWNSMGLEAKRALIETLMTIKLHPVGRGARVFDPTSVEVTWTE